MNTTIIEIIKDYLTSRGVNIMMRKAFSGEDGYFFYCYVEDYIHPNLCQSKYYDITIIDGVVSIEYEYGRVSDDVISREYQSGKMCFNLADPNFLDKLYCFFRMRNE